MGFGTKIPKGSLPVFSVDTEEDAKALLSLACETNYKGEYVARELVMEQTLDNLQAFSDRLAKTWEFLVARREGRKDVPFPHPPPREWR